MNSLILDCSNGMGLYVLNNDKLYSMVSKTEKKHTDELLLALDGLLDEAKLKITDINNICVCTGPGSFTGIRVAVSVCKGLAIGTNAKVFAGSNFDAMSYSQNNDAYYLCEAFSDYVYVRSFLKNTYRDECMHFSDFVVSYKKGFNVYVNSEKLQNQLKDNEIPCEIAQNYVVELFKAKISNNENINLNEIEPIYLRASQAEIEREKKLSGGNNG